MNRGMNSDEMWAGEFKEKLLLMSGCYKCFGVIVRGEWNK